MVAILSIKANEERFKVMVKYSDRPSFVSLSPLGRGEARGKGFSPQIQGRFVQSIITKQVAKLPVVLNHAHANVSACHGIGTA
jgi:hypothetical protein